MQKRSNHFDLILPQETPSCSLTATMYYSYRQGRIKLGVLKKKNQLLIPKSRFFPCPPIMYYSISSVGADTHRSCVRVSDTTADHLRVHIRPHATSHALIRAWLICDEDPSQLLAQITCDLRYLFGV